MKYCKFDFAISTDILMLILKSPGSCIRLHSLLLSIPLNAVIFHLSHHIVHCQSMQSMSFFWILNANEIIGM